MSTPVPDSKTPVFVAFGLIALGIVIAALHGVVHGSIGGGILAACGALPGLAGMWKGLQQETQGTLAWSVASVIAALVIGGVLIVLGVVHAVV
jgi:hypothetical protein